MNNPQLIPVRKILTVVALTVLTNSIGPLAQAQFSANNQTNTISGVASNWVDNGTYVIGSNTFLDTLIIQSGGVLSNGFGYIGYETSASNNTAIVSGAGSAWTNQFDLYIGLESAGNQLIITNGATVVSSNGYIGFANFLVNTNNTVIVTGAGSVWTNSGGLDIGLVSGGNQLIIANGGQVFDQGAAVGDSPGAATNGAAIDNTVLVIGTNSAWINYGNVALNHNSPSNVLTVANGGRFAAQTVSLGTSGASDGIVALVTDPGSIWTNTGVLDIGGYGGFNQFIVSNGASAHSTNARLGTTPGGGGGDTVTVTGPGSIWTVHLLLSIGEYTTGCSVIVTNGGLVTAQAEILGSSGGSGSLIIAGGTNEVFASLDVGQSGSTATVSVLSGALFVTNAAASAVATVNSNSTLVLGMGIFKADNLVVTNGGAVQYVSAYQVDNSTVTVAGGSTVQAGSNLTVASTANTTGTVLVVGGTLVATNGTLGVGNNGTITSGGGVGLLVVSNGTLQAVIIALGSSAGGQGDLTLADGGNISCPGGADCLIVINSKGWTQVGGDLVWTNGSMQCGVTQAGDYSLTNAMASFQNLYMGYSDVGTMTMLGGVVNISSHLIVGHLGPPFSGSTSTGVVWISGGQITMNSDYSIIGNSGVGQMTISNGTVTAANVFVCNSSNPGTLTLAGGTLTVDSLVLTNPGSRFTFAGGSLNANAISNVNGQTFTVGDGVNPATLNLLGGVTSVAQGLKVSTGATLSGFGTISGTVVNFGLISPSTTLTFTGGNVTNNGTIRAVSGTVIETYGPLVNNGTIDIINGGGTNFHSGFINNGTILDAHSVRVSNTVTSSNNVVIQIPSVTGHTYQLQAGSSLTSTNWVNSGSPQSGTGGILTFTDLGGATNPPPRFYRLGCSSP